MIWSAKRMRVHASALTVGLATATFLAYRPAYTPMRKWGRRKGANEWRGHIAFPIRPTRANSVQETSVHPTMPHISWRGFRPRLVLSMNGKST
jgi:hypothetical protein